MIFLRGVSSAPFLAEFGIFDYFSPEFMLKIDQRMNTHNLFVAQ